MTEHEQKKKDKRQKAVNWVAIIGALSAGSVAVVDSVNGSAQDDTIKVTMVRELSALKEWKGAAVGDFGKLDELVRKQEREIAALTATVKLLTERDRKSAKEVIARVADSVVGETDGDGKPVDPLEGLEHVPRKPRHKLKSGAAPKPLTEQQVQKQVEELF